MKNRVLLENYFLPSDLENQIGTFVEYYNHQRYHKSLGNVTTADVSFGRDQAILKERKKIKKLTIQNRRLQHQKQAAYSNQNRSRASMLQETLVYHFI